MQKKLFSAVLTVCTLSACSITINDEEIEGRKGQEQSLEVRRDDKLDLRISCTKGKQPYKEGGENGEAVVMGCR